jgi:large subunit ribosomal protein L30e
MEMVNIDHELRQAFKTGRVRIGSKQTLKEIRRGRAKIAILSSNCPEKIQVIVKDYGKLGDIPVLVHNKDSIDLGILCGKPFPTSAIVINDPGDSKILDIVEV